MKILLISDLYPAFPGQPVDEVSHVLHYFARRWVPGENVLVIRPYIVPGFFKEKRSFKKGEFLLDNVRVYNCPVFKIPKLRLFYLNSIFKYLRKNHYLPDVVVAHLGFNLLFGYRISKSLGIPLISGVHTGDFRFGLTMLSEKRLKKIYKLSSGIVCRSYHLFERFAQWLPELEERCFVVHSGIKKEIIEKKDFALKKMKSWKRGSKIVFISVCNLIKRKNLDTSLRVLSRLNDKTDWIYKIVGHGPERSYLEGLSKEFKIEQRVEFLGSIPSNEVIRELRDSHVFIMVSSFETFGLAYLEAMATGNIVVGSMGEGIDGIIKNNFNGFLCKPGEISELKDVITKIVFQLNEDELGRILEHSSSTIQKFTEENAAENYLKNIYKYCKK